MEKQKGIIIELNKIFFHFGNNNAIFKGISFSTYKNEVVSIIGSSGSGKTTLLNILAGLLSPYSGEVKVEEDNLTYLTQTVTLLPYRTAFENSLLALELRSLLTEEKIVQAERLFEGFELDKSALNKYPEQLSGGMKQRVGLIQNLLIDASLYLFDEPFTAIDRRIFQKIAEIIWKRFRTNKSSAVIVTHDIDQAVQISDRVFLINNNIKPFFREIKFKESFISLSPAERRNHVEFNSYIFEIIKSQNEE